MVINNIDNIRKFNVFIIREPVCQDRT